MVYELAAANAPGDRHRRHPTGEDALEFLLVGARAVQVGTATFYDPGAGPKILRQITKFLEAEGIDRVQDFVGSLKTGVSS